RSLPAAYVLDPVERRDPATRPALSGTGAAPGRRPQATFGAVGRHAEARGARPGHLARTPLHHLRRADERAGPGDVQPHRRPHQAARRRTQCHQHRRHARHALRPIDLRPGGLHPPGPPALGRHDRRDARQRRRSAAGLRQSQRIPDRPAGGERRVADDDVPPHRRASSAIPPPPFVPAFRFQYNPARPVKYSKEIKVGLTLLFSAVIFILGIRFFQDLPLFRGPHSLYSTFEDASGILPGNAVRVNGVRVVSVDEVVLDPETNEVRVHFHVDEEIAVPEGSHTEIGGIAALNSVHLRLHLGPASNPRVAEGGLIPSLREANLLGQLTEQAPGLVEQVDTLLYSANATFASANRLLTGSDEDLRRTLAAFRGTAETLNDLLRAEQARLSRTLANFDQASGDLSLLAAGLRGIKIGSA